MRLPLPTPCFMRVSRTSNPTKCYAFRGGPEDVLAVPGRRAQYSSTGPESVVPRATSGRGGGRLLPQEVLRTSWGPRERGRPGAVAGPRLFARRDPPLRIAPLREEGCA